MDNIHMSKIIIFIIFFLWLTTVYIHLYGVYFLYVLNIVLQYLPKEEVLLHC